METLRKSLKGLRLSSKRTGKAGETSKARYVQKANELARMKERRQKEIAMARVWR